LREIFNHASKNGKGRGIPDRIYFDGEVLIVFECKCSSISLAMKDLRNYHSKMKIGANYKLFFVAMTKDEYKIFSADFNEMNVKLRPHNFGIASQTLSGKYNLNARYSPHS
jgi:hypothetical protein